MDALQLTRMHSNNESCLFEKQPGSHHDKNLSINKKRRCGTKWETAPDFRRMRSIFDLFNEINGRVCWRMKPFGYVTHGCARKIECMGEIRERIERKEKDDVVSTGEGA
jgi:hypothetical protein